MSSGNVKYYNNFKSRQTYGWSEEQDRQISSTTVVLSSSDISEFICGEDIENRDVIFIANDKKIYKASAFSFSSSFGVGISLENSLSGTLNKSYIKHGTMVDGFCGLSCGERYFLDDKGKITNNINHSGSYVIYQIGIASADNCLIFYPQLLLKK